jgi:nitrate reductase NapE
LGGLVTDTKIDHKSSRLRELMGFLFLTVVLAPAVTVAIVGGYGFVIWMYQIVVGPPGQS